MINPLKITIITGVVLFGLTNQILAQTSEKDSLSGETVIIVKEFEPVIKNAKKITHQPVLNRVEKSDAEFNYDILPQNSKYTFSPDTIKPVKIKGEPLDHLYRAYVKAGMGNYLNSYGELHVNSVRSRDLMWGLDANHIKSLD